MAFQSGKREILCVVGWLLLGWGPAKAQTPAANNSPGNNSAQAPAHDSAASQSKSDLDAAAKSTRKEREQEKAQRSGRSDVVNQLAKELSDSDEEPIAGAPTGFRYYYFKPGDYAILVPADAKPEARDNFGLRLFSNEAFTYRIEVILGEPILGQGDTPEEIIHNANAQYFAGCAMNISGLGEPVDGHPAHTVGLSCGMSQQVLGYAEYVLSDGYVMPVICGYPLTREDLDPNPHQPYKKIVDKYTRERNGFTVCERILPSLRFHPYAGRWNPKIGPAPEKKPAVTSALLSSGNAPTSPEGASLGAFARAHKKIPTHAVMTEIKHASPGYEPLTFRYACTKDNSTCYNASVEIPARAKRNDQFQNPYTWLFEYEVPFGSDTVYVQFNTGVSTEPGIITREEFIKTKADWWIGYTPAAHYSSVAAAKVLREELTEINGIPTRLATFTNPTGSQTVLTYLAAYMVPGKFIQIRCTAPEKDSGDAQGMCEHVLRSLEVPQSKEDQVNPEDPPESDDPPQASPMEDDDQ